MKFQNPETEEVFQNLQQASDAFCSTYGSFCHGCPIDKVSMGRSCLAWIQEHSHEAARLMGFGVVEENSNKLKETLINGNKEGANMDKPRICEVSEDGFEEICEAVHNGWMDEKKRQGMTEHPDMHPYHELPENVKEYDRVTVRCVLDALGIKYTQKPRWTRQEVEFAKAIKVLFPCAIAVVKAPSGSVSVSGASLVLSTEYFPSIQPGHSYTIDNIIGGAE